MLPSLAWAHGEDKLGPHGGYVRMPGAFHTEVKISGHEVQVYLLDMEWKNPTVENSTVRVSYQGDAKISKLKCNALKNEFSCELPKSFNSKRGKLRVTAVRNGAKGGVAEYNIPLKLQ